MPRSFLTPRLAALAPLLLSGTALSQPAVNLDTIAVEGSAAARGPATGALPLDSSATSGGGGGPSGVVGFTAKASPTATKTNTPLIETPQSVTVVTREQLEARNVQTLNEALAYAPGTSTDVFGFDPRFDAFYIRGFDATYNGVFRDGLRQSAVGLAVPRIEPYGTEAVTILRGPVSGLYGLGSPGGIVDVTTKRPVFTPFGEIQFQAGNFDRFQGNFDLGGPVEGSNGTLAYRLTGVVRQSDTFLPGATDDRINIAPAFTWKPSADTTFTLLTEFQRSQLPGTAAFYNFSGFRVSRLYFGDGAFNAFTQNQYRIGYAFEHHFSPDLIFRQNFRYYGVDGDFPYVTIDSITGLTAQRSTGFFRESLQSVAVDTQLEAHIATGPVAHTLLGGVDYQRYTWDRLGGFGTAPDLDLTTLNYGRQFIARPAFSLAVHQVQDQVGVYLQEQAKWDRFILTLTGRHDWVSQTSASGTPGALGTPSTQNDSAFTGRVGLNYILAPGLVPYASYATTFTPQVGADVTGRPFKSATGDQIEAGVKVAVPGTNITAGFAGFDIRQSSLLRQDPASPANQVATGSVSSRGFEAEMIANFGPGTNLTLAYTHLDFRFVRQTSLVTGGPIDGNALSGLPGDSFKAFATYLFPTSSWLSGLTVGGGIRFAANSFADDENTVRNPTVTLFDAMIA